MARWQRRQWLPTAAAVATMVVAEATATATVMMAAATAGVKKQQSTSNGSVEGGRWTWARQRVTTNNKSAWPMMRVVTKRAARVMAIVTRVAGEWRRRWWRREKRVRTSRAMVTRAVGNKEGGGDGGNMVRNNDDGLIPVIVQQAVLFGLC